MPCRSRWPRLPRSPRCRACCSGAASGPRRRCSATSRSATASARTSATSTPPAATSRMIVCVALGMAMRNRGRRQVLWWCLAAASGAGLWFSESRSALGAAGAVVIVGMLWAATSRFRPQPRAAVLAVAVTALLGGAAVRAMLLEADPDYRGVGFRQQFVQTSVRMIARAAVVRRRRRPLPLVLAALSLAGAGHQLRSGECTQFFSPGRRRARPGRPRVVCDLADLTAGANRASGGACTARRAAGGRGRRRGRVHHHLPDRASVPPRRGGVSVLAAVRADDGAGGRHAAERHGPRRRIARVLEHTAGVALAGCSGRDRHSHCESDHHGKGRRDPVRIAGRERLVRMGDAGGRHAVSLDRPLREPVRAGRRHTRGDPGPSAHRRPEHPGDGGRGDDGRRRPRPDAGGRHLGDHQPAAGAGRCRRSSTSGSTSASIGSGSRRSTSPAARTCAGLACRSANRGSSANSAAPDQLSHPFHQ